MAHISKSPASHQNSRKALIDHIDEEDKDDVTIRDALGRNQTMTAINESGLYSLILMTTPI